MSGSPHAEGMLADVKFLTVAEVAELPLEQVTEARELGSGLASLDQPIGDDGESSLGDMLPSDAPAPFDEIVQSFRDSQLAKGVGRLPEQERQVLELRYGLTGGEPRTLRQTGTDLGITPTKVSELEARALARLASDQDLEALREAA